MVTIYFSNKLLYNYSFLIGSATTLLFDWKKPKNFAPGPDSGRADWFAMFWSCTLKSLILSSFMCNKFSRWSTLFLRISTASFFSSRSACIFSKTAVGTILLLGKLCTLLTGAEKQFTLHTHHFPTHNCSLLNKTLRNFHRPSTWTPLFSSPPSEASRSLPPRPWPTARSVSWSE
jgi:hypothetical protein